MIQQAVKLSQHKVNTVQWIQCVTEWTNVLKLCFSLDLTRCDLFILQHMAHFHMWTWYPIQILATLILYIFGFCFIGLKKSSTLPHRALLLKRCCLFCSDSKTKKERVSSLSFLVHQELLKVPTHFEKGDIKIQFSKSGALLFFFFKMIDLLCVRSVKPLKDLKKNVT